MKAVIITNGHFEKMDIIKKECSNADYIICADGGAEYAYRNNIMPDYMIGDFDSLNPDILRYYENKSIKICRYPSEKDFTDTELCVEKALELYCDEIRIVGGIGGRIDHSLGNISLLHIILDKGAKGCIIGDDFIMYMCRDKINICGQEGDILSLIPFGGDVKGVTTHNLKYPLNKSILYFGRPIGISNLLTSSQCEIELESGELLVIKYDGTANRQTMS